MIQFRCPHCNRRMRVKEEAAGKKGQCKQCGKMIRIPSASVAETPELPEPSPAPRTEIPDLQESFPTLIENPVQPMQPVGQSVSVQVNVQTPSKAAHSLGIGSVILGILAFLICWIPFIGLIGVPLSALGLLMGIGGIVIAALRKGSGLGFPVAGSAICGLALFVAISITWATGKAIEGTVAAIDEGFEELEKERAKEKAAIKNIGANGQQNANNNEKADNENGKNEVAAKKEKAAPKIKIADASTETFKLGDIEVKIQSVIVDEVELKGFGGDKETSKDKQLKIALQIKNIGDSKKIDYRGWSGADGGFLHAASLQDNLDNSYKRIGFGFTSKVVGQIRTESIYPGKSITDLLVFEIPIQKAEYLVLKLPAKAFGGDGDLRFVIIKEMIKR